MYMQQFMVLGRATKDPEFLESKKKKAYAKFSLAVNEYKKEDKEESAVFYDVVVINKTAKKLSELLKKGDLILLKGKPECEAYLSKDNQPKAKITVFADEWQVIK